MSQQQPVYQMTPPPPTAQPKKGRSNGMALFLAICVAFVPMIFIFGILAAIAIPNFQKFGAKAKQSEAKTKLAMVYTGEKAFIAEWNVATSDLVSLGVDPALNDGTTRYHVGFAQPANAQWETIGVGEQHDASRSDSEKAGMKISVDLGAPFETLAAQYCADCVADGENFKIVAIGNIDTDPTLDVWTIDQDRTMTNIVDDTKE